MWYCFVFFFFFQAEDGIRDLYVTGVQTCALPIFAEADALTAILETFPDRFQAALRDALFARLGLVPGNMAEDMTLVAALEEALAKQSVTIDRFFFDWRGGRSPGSYQGFDEVRTLLEARAAVPGALDHPYWS